MGVTDGAGPTLSSAGPVEPAPPLGTTPLGRRSDVRLGALLAVCLVSAWCSLWRLERDDWHFDELLYAGDGWATVHGGLPSAGHPPVAKVLFGIGQLVAGPNVVGARLVVALLGVAVTVVVFQFGRAVSGWWTGVVAAALWAVLPTAADVVGPMAEALRVGRLALVDPVAACLGVVTLAAGWQWCRTGSLQWATGTGVALGLAVAAKVTAVGFAPALLLLAFVTFAPLSVAWRQVRRMGLTSIGVFVLTYLPFGTAGPRLFADMVDNQVHHARLGHPVLVAGRVWRDAPWWANAWFFWEANGPLLASVLLAACFSAWWARERIAVAYLWVALVGPVALLSTSPVALPHYWPVVAGPLALLVAVGVTSALQATGARRAFGLAAALVLAGAGVRTVAHVTTIGHGDFGRMAAVVEAQGVPPRTAVSLGPGMEPYFPGVRTTYGAFAGDGFTADLVVIERSHALRSTPAVIDRLRAGAEASGLVPRVEGDVEYWFRSR